MANAAQLYRFRIDLADIDRNAYEVLDFRMAQHPSESMPFLITRVLAYALNFEPGLEFSKEGLADPDAPAIAVASAQGGYETWIEIGNPTARRLHKATKSAKRVIVFTYKDPQLVLKEIATNAIYNAGRIEIFSLATPFLNRLGETLERDSSWNVMRSDGTVTVTSGDRSESVELERHALLSR